METYPTNLVIPIILDLGKVKSYWMIAYCLQFIMHKFSCDSPGYFDIYKAHTMCIIISLVGV